MKEYIEAKKLIPVIESDVFSNPSGPRFAIGEVAVNDAIVNGYHAEYDGAAMLRANIYLDKGFVRKDELDDRGTELDADDARSTHFVLLERLPVDSLARVIGNMRLVVKGEGGDNPLPVEGFFPEIFSDNPLPVGSIEVSRLIAKHEDLRVQSLLKWPLFIAGNKYAVHNDLGPVYGLISAALTRELRMQHVPITPIANPREIEEIHAAKQPVVINNRILTRLIKSTGDMGIDVSNGGFSYFDIPEAASEEVI